MINTLIPDFTPAAYRFMLETAVEKGYRFSFFDRLGSSQLDLTCYLRHDIDVDLKAAYQLSVIEKETGVTATYFIMLRSPVYNLFSRANHRYVEQIISNGHRIALHFDENFACSLDMQLQEQIDRELQVLKIMFGVESRVVSFHQPSERILSQAVELPGIINTYDKNLFRNIHYVSDSNKVWKAEHPVQLFSEKKFSHIQLLIHPMWWVLGENFSTREVWRQTLIDSFYQRQEQIVETERAYGKPFRMSLDEME